MTTHNLPYPGLRAFRREESHLFFGRESCVDAMINRLAATRFLAVLGASGSGKSSLVRTGLLDGLELGFYANAGSRWTVIDLHPGGQPMRNLASALANASIDNPEPADIELLCALVTRGPRSIIKWCLSGALKPDYNLLILVDQFEELFRYGDYAAREEAEAFVALLLESAHAKEVPIHIVLTMRSEYLGVCSLVQGLAEQINAGFYLTPRMTREECRQAIEGPAAVGGFSIQPALVNQLLNDMASFAPWEEETGVQQSQILSRRADQLPLMQHLLNQLWLRAHERSPQTAIALTMTDYHETGGLAGALDAHGAQVISTLQEEDPENIEMIFRALVSGPDPTNAVRQPCQFADLVVEAKGSVSAARRIINAFRAIDCNFLQPESDVPLEYDTVIDISHESLIRQWVVLAEWLRHEARADANWCRLLIGAERHSTNDGDLLAGNELQYLASWWDKDRPTIPWSKRHGGQYEEVAAYLTTSRDAEAANKKAAEDAQAAKRQAARDQEKRKRQILVAGVFGLSTLLAVAINEWQKGRILNEKFAKINRAIEDKNRLLEDETELKNKAINDAQTNAAMAKENEKKANDNAAKFEEKSKIAKLEQQRADEANRTSLAEAQKYAASIGTIQDVLFSEKYKDRLGVLELQTELSGHMTPAFVELGKKYAAVQPISQIRAQKNLAINLAAVGNAADAMEHERIGFELGIKALTSYNKSNNEYPTLIGEVLRIGTSYVWSLQDAGADVNLKKILDQLDGYSKLYPKHLAPPQLILPLARYYRLRELLEPDFDKAGEKAKKWTDLGEEVVTRKDVLDIDKKNIERYKSYFIKEKVSQTDSKEDEIDKKCFKQEGYLKENQNNIYYIVEYAICRTGQADQAQRINEPDKADKFLADAFSEIDSALRREPTNSPLLLARSELLIDKANIFLLRKNEKANAENQRAAAEQFITALQGRTIQQRTTAQVKYIYNGFANINFSNLSHQKDNSINTKLNSVEDFPKEIKNPNFPQISSQLGEDSTKKLEVSDNPNLLQSSFQSMAVPTDFYTAIRNAVALHRKKFPHAPEFAYIDGDAAIKIGEDLMKQGKISEAEQMFKSSIAAIKEGRVLDKNITAQKFSEDPANLCKAWTKQIELLTTTGRVNDAIAAYKDMTQTFTPFLTKFSWDYYLRSPIVFSTSKLGKLLYEENRYQEAMPLLQYTSDWGIKESSELLADIYREGKSVPIDLVKSSALQALSERQSIKRFTIPTVFSGEKYPFHVYIQEYAPGIGPEGINDQVEWVKEARGGVIEPDVVSSFKKLYAIAKENKVSFPDLAVYALGEAQKEKTKPQGSKKPTK